MLMLFRQTQVFHFWTDGKELLSETKPRARAFWETGIQHTQTDKNRNKTL